MNNDTTIGQNVRRIRRAHTNPSLTQAGLANHLDLSYQQVQKYENGTNRIAAGRIPHIAAFLGCTIMDLYEGTES